MLSIGFIIILAFIALCLVLMLFSDTSTFVFFHWYYFIFDIGIRLKRYEEYTENHEEGRVRKELVIGFIFGKLVMNFYFQKELVEVHEDTAQ